jgi:uncharacterized protein involved in exopolysaccharide biosynthesis
VTANALRTLLVAFPLLAEFRAARWTIAITACVFGVLGASFAFVVKPQYRAQVTLMPVESKGIGGLASQLGALGGLAGLAGVNLGGANKVEPLAVLSSREFVRSFIEDEKLTTVLLADKWDAKAGKWKDEGRDQPDIRDAVEFFTKSVRKVGEDRKAGLVILTVEWTNAIQAARWANLMAQRVNVQMRDRAVVKASRSIEYLRGEFDATNQVALQQTISRLIETQMQDMMVARGNPEYAFRIIDPAHVPKKRFFPKRALIILGATLIGGFLACAWITLARVPRPEQNDTGRLTA